MTREESKTKTFDILQFVADNAGLSTFEAIEKAYNMGVSKQEPRWIPVSERLPEDKQSVLVWCPEYKNIYCAYLEKEQWWIFGAFVQVVPNAVVAWMPLPEPYKAESEKEK